MLTDKKITKIRKAFNGADQRVIFKILGDTNRYLIFEMLGNQPRISVSDIAKVLKISMPLASQHLKILEQGNMLDKEKQGQKVYYKLNTDNRIAHAITKEIIQREFMENFMPRKAVSAFGGKKDQVIILARELFKIRMSSSREGFAQDDGVHTMKVKGITSYDDRAIKKWYTEALKTAEIIVALEEEYLNTENYKYLENPA